MLNIRFVPESEQYAHAVGEYTAIWEADGTRIAETIEQVTGLRIEDTQVEALVFEGISQSEPFRLRASYDREAKTATTVHELVHRLCAQHELELPAPRDERGVAAHMQIDLVLYDIWCNLYGQEFADRQVVIESERAQGKYKEAWDWALAMTAEERQARFASLVPEE